MRKGIYKPCPICSTLIYVRPCYINDRSRDKYCSVVCKGKGRRLQPKIPRITVECGVCGKPFLVLPSRIAIGHGKLCSRECRKKAWMDAGYKARATSRFKKIAKANIAKLHAKVSADETLHPRWKGNQVGYYGVHDWITKHYGQPIGCEQCGLNDPNRKYHWANLSGQYLRDRTDFRRMCVSCHRKYDYAAARKNKALAATS